MLKYEPISRNSGDDPSGYVSRVLESDGAFRVTTMFMISDTPDIRYYYKGVWHRTDGPAYIDYDGGKGSIDFRIHGEAYYSTKQYCKAAGMSDEDTFMWLLRFGDDLPDTIEGFYGEAWKDMTLDQF